MDAARSRIPVALAALLMLTPGAADAQSSPTSQQAGALLQRQQFDSAAAVARAAIARDSSDGEAWTTLGAALLSGGHAAESIPVHRRAMQFDAKRPAAMYNLGLAYGRIGQPDSAFLWLERARGTGRVNLADIDLDPDAAPLRDDPRYRALKPSADDLAHPFVEPAAILQEWRGEHTGDQFGWIARDIGDVDGDGAHDVVTSAPTFGSERDTSGAVYVYSSRSGKLLWRAVGAAGDQLGTGVEAAGDVDGDGVPDVTATAPGGGKAYIYAGRTGRVLRTLQLTGALQAAGVGDVDEDGHADVIVGSPAAADGFGAAIVFSGSDGSALLSLHGPARGSRFGSAVSGTSANGHVLLVVGAPRAGPMRTGVAYIYDALDTVPRLTFDGDSTSFALAGMFVSVPGDLDGDASPDVYLSDWNNSARGRSTGRIYVLSGRSGHPILSLTGESAGEGFGTCPGKVGDVNGDGRDDLIIGAWQFAGRAVSGGKIYLHSGRDGALLRTWTGRIPGETLGFDAVGLGDVNGDGAIDYLVTSAWSSVRGSHSGRVFILSGATGM